MSALVKARIAGMVAAEVRLVPFPSAPFGYGSDISGGFDVDPSMSEVDPLSTLGIAQSLVRRLDCPRGENRDDLDYGIGLRQMINRGIEARDLNQIAGQIRLELLKDDRVDNLSIAVAPLEGGKRLRIQIQVTPVDRNVGAFRLTMNASSAAILIDAIESER